MSNDYFSKMNHSEGRRQFASVTA